MSDLTKVPEKVIECVTEPAKAALTPIAQTVGETVSDLLRLICWPVTTGSKLASGKQDYLISKQNAKQELYLAKFKEEIEEKLNKIPEDKLITPDRRIVCDAMEKCQSAVDVDAIRRLYANLIANAANADIADQIHPSFSAIISQLSPLDVQNLEIIARDNYFPIANFVRFVKDGIDSEYRNLLIVHPEVFLENPKNQNITFQAISLNSLARLQLITIDYTKSVAGDDAYSQIQAYYDEHFKNTYTSEYGTYFEKGVVSTTLLGRAFIAVCRGPFDPISETSVEL